MYLFATVIYWAAICRCIQNTDVKKTQKLFHDSSLGSYWQTYESTTTNLELKKKPHTGDKESLNRCG